MTPRSAAARRTGPVPVGARERLSHQLAAKRLLVSLDVDQHQEAREFLRRLPGPAEVKDGGGALAELARLNEEAAVLLARAVDGERVTAHERAGHYRRQAWVLVQLAECHLELENAAQRAVALWQEHEEAAVTEAVADYIACGAENVLNDERHTDE
ncbi:hypothetical protein [Streptomyces sp. NPDC051162]|uniref:hypothetical protein n=1 Tax=Streptomyces sp. NPDC051162 TaxID=3154747 RepID=UPI0034345327